MFKFNLKSMLLMSTSSEKVLHHHKRFKLGKFYYAVQFDLMGTNLIIKNVKKTKRTPQIEKSLRRRCKRISELLKLHRTYINVKSDDDTSDSTTIATVRSCVQHDKETMTDDNPSQIDLINCQTQTTEHNVQQNTISTDCTELIFYKTRAQQTESKLVEKGLQTDTLSITSTSVQVKCYMTDIFTKTDMYTSIAATQTEQSWSHCYVQTDLDAKYEEFEHITPKALLFRIYQHLTTQSLLLRNNNRLTEQLLELRQLDNKRLQNERERKQASQEAPEIKIKKNSAKYKTHPRTKTVRLVQKCAKCDVPIRGILEEIIDKSTQTDFCVEQSEKSTQTAKRRGRFCLRSREPKSD